MDPRYSLSKSGLLGWINDTLGLHLTKVEETANGAVACQLLDALYPGVVPLEKVDFNAKNEFDMVSNYKLLQLVFFKLKVDKHIEVDKLIKGRAVDSMEFMQWLRDYFERHTGGTSITDYDWPGRRAQSKTGDIKGQTGANSKLAGDGMVAAAGAAEDAPLADKRSIVVLEKEKQVLRRA